jgi:RNA polymerase sigma factor (sigma-70 family)
MIGARQLLARLAAPRRTSSADDPTDRDLLSHYLKGDDAAFAALLRRHGPMVLGVCRRVLRHVQDAEDAFQATFLILARNAAVIRRRDAVAGYLHGVAQRTAAQLRVYRASRRECPLPASEPRRASPEDEPTWRELRAALDEELARLPERFRAPIVLCHLEETTQTEAAARLGWSKGTLRRRLDRGLALLRARLTGRGLSLPAGMLAVAFLCRTADATPPSALLENTLRAAGLIRTGSAIAPVASARVVALVQEGVKRMTWLKWKVGILLVVAVGLTAGAGLCARQALRGKPTEAGPTDPPPAAKAPPVAAADPLPPGVLARMGASRLWQPEAIAALAFTSDGKTVATLAADGSVRLWSASDGRQQAAFEAPAAPANPANTFDSLTFTFSADDKLLAASDPGLGVCVFDVSAGKPNLRLPGGQGKEIYRAAFAPDGKTLATVGANGLVVLRDAGSGKEVRRFEGHEGPVLAVAFSPDGSLLLTGGEDRTVALWKVETGKLLKELDGHRTAVHSVAFAPDGKRAASGGDEDGDVLVWDVTTGERVRRFRGGAAALRFTADGSALAAGLANAPVASYVAAGRADRSAVRLQLWDLKTGRDLREGDARPETWHALVFSPDGKALAAATWGGSIYLHDVASGKDLCPTPGHRGGVSALAYSPDGKVLATGGADRRVCLWDAATGKEMHTCEGHNGVVCCLSFAPDGKTLASAGDDTSDGSVILWDVASGKERRQLRRHAWPVDALCFSPDGKLLIARERGGLYVWKTASGKEVAKLATGPAGAVAVAFAPDGKSLIALGFDRMLRRWDVDGWEEASREVEAGQEMGYFLLFSPDCKSLLGSERAGDTALSLSLWDVETFTRVRPLGRAGQTADPPLPSPGIFAAFSADGRMLAAGGEEEDVVVWEIASGRERARLPAHFGRLPPLGFSPDGRALACGGEDGVTLVYDLARPDGKGLAPKAALTAAELDSLWRDLEAEDAARAFRALSALRAAPASSAPYLAGRLKPAVSVRAERLHALIADLDADDFKVRSAAADELAKAGKAAEPALKKLLEGKPSVEVRQRAEALLRQLQTRIPTPEQLRELRAVEVLERLDRAEARKALEALANGAPDARLTEDARAALARLARRAVP